MKKLLLILAIGIFAISSISAIGQLFAPGVASTYNINASYNVTQINLTGVAWSDVVNGTVVLNSSLTPWLNNYYLVTNPFSFYNSTTLPATITWANVVNGTVYKSSNPFGFYNSTTLPASTGVTNASLTFYLANYLSKNTDSSLANSNYTFTNIFLYPQASRVGIGTLVPQSNLQIDSTTPEIILNDTNQIANAQRFSIFSDAGQLILRATSDDGATWNSAMKINRSGSSIGYVSFPSGYVNVSGLLYAYDNQPYPTWANVTNGTLRPTTNLSFLGGNVGINTSSPARLLDIVSTGNPLRLTGNNSIAQTSGATQDNILRLAPLGSGVALDFGASGSPAGGWLQARNNANYAVDYPILLNPNGGGVGINTTISRNALDVVGIVNVTNATGRQAIYVDSSGNLGVGSAGTSAKLTVVTGSNNYSGILVSNPSNNNYEGAMIALEVAGILNRTGGMIYITGSGSQTYCNTLDLCLFNNFSQGTSTTNGAISFITNASGLIVNAMRISNNGNVGIGALNAVQKLDVVGNANITGGIYQFQQLIPSWINVTNGTLVTWANESSNQFAYLNTTNGGFTFTNYTTNQYSYYNNTQGNLTVGTTTLQSLVNISYIYTTLPTCSSTAGTNGSVARNTTGLVSCSTKGNWQYLVKYA